MQNEIKIPFYAKATIILVGIISTSYILYIGESVIVPFLFALFIAILTNPIVNFLHRRGVNRVVSIFVAVIVVLLFVIALGFFISLQVTMFSDTYPQFKEKFDVTIKSLVSWSAQSFHIDAQTINNWLSDMHDKAISTISSGVGPAILSVGGTLLFVVIIPVYIILILYYKSLLLDFLTRLSSANNRSTMIEVLQSINTIIRSYLFGLVIEGAIVATLNSVALLILGVEYAILLGVSGAILNVIPFIGGIVAVALPMLVAFVTKSPLTALLVFIIYIIIQFIDNHYLIPYIVASKVKLNALTAIVVVLIGDLLWGLPGMFLSIPLTALIKIICDHIDSLKPFGILLGDEMPSSEKSVFKNWIPKKN